MKRVQEYIWDSQAVGHYATTRNSLLGSNYSSKLSPWLACGSISPRYVYFEVKQFEEKRRKNESTKIYVDELFWRDFNRYWCLRYGNKVFHSYGIYDRTYYDWKDNKETIQRWREGRTGMPLIDALIRDMNATGFMPNRGRMVVACYLTMDLKQNWLQGAYHFEEKLIDHDV
jgi:deoxyribodipyrimidine photo-lyase